MGQLDFALVGNCQVSGLLDTRGRYVWMGLPRLDSPACFNALLGGEEAGYWSVEPVSGTWTTTQQYVPLTNVVVTRFDEKGGDAFEVVDFAPRYSSEPGVYHRPPRFTRIVRPVQGTARVRLVVSPRFHYGKTAPSVVSRGLGCVFEGGEGPVHLQTATAAWDQGFDLDRSHYFVLSHGTPLEGDLPTACDRDLERTQEYWKSWIKHCRIPLHYQDEVIRSALALKLHVFEETGAIIAATTTSIPESTHGGRNWDYRFCWLRDAYFVTHAFGLLSRITEVERYVDFLAGIMDRHKEGELQPVYAIDGRAKLTEEILDWLPGFKGIGPVRVGNAAYVHHQYDVYGEVVLAIAPVFMDRRMDHFDRKSAFEKVFWAVEKAIEVFPKADAGIWEIRGEENHFLFSKVMCWAAVDRGILIAESMGETKRVAHWKGALDEMRAEIESKGWREDVGMYTQHWGNSTPDAANLLMGPLGFHPHDHPRFRRMLEGYSGILLEKGVVFRYRNADDFGVPRNAFTICSYWYVDFLIGLGKRKEAQAMFEELLTTRNHVGLVSEDLDPDTRELWGNFPQTYSHVGIINTAFRLSEDIMAPDLNAPH